MLKSDYILAGIFFGRTSNKKLKWRSYNSDDRQESGDQAPEASDEQPEAGSQRQSIRTL
ncbi:MAG: hypothetical protein PVI71_04650 [Desulfobacterales bacterium]|jgi:hypothetical protein